MDDSSQYLIICIIAIAMGTGCILYSLLVNKYRKFVLTKGEKVEGIVFEVEGRPRPTLIIGTSDYADYSEYSQKVTIRFVTKKLEWITVDIDKSKAKFSFRKTVWYKPGDKLSIFYKPDNPHDFHIEPPAINATEQIVFIIAGIVLIGVGIYFLLTAP